jgi:nicotinate phosphoribosyltransferase
MVIIQSLLDTDLYKFTMGQVVFHKFPDAMVEYTFKCRNEDVDLSPYANEIIREIDSLCELRFQDDEIEYLRKLGWFKPSYLEFLKLLKLDSKCVEITSYPGNFGLKIVGPWLSTIYFEVPILAIINEVYFRHKAGITKENECQLDAKDWRNDGLKNLRRKIELVNEKNFIKFSDFGTRRRFSRDWQDFVIGELKSNLLLCCFTGTSNVYFAKKYNITPIGTMAHEFIQACQAFVRIRDSQKFAFQTWAEEYRGDLGIALSDTLGMDAFLNDFDKYFAKLFDGARHDSGDPFVWCDKLIEHYKKLKIDPMTKTAVFSDGLTFPKAIELVTRFKGRINTAFGIGTNLMNDCSFNPLNIVIKMTQCNGYPVAKISDTPSKQMCKDENYLNYLKSVFNIK